MGPVNNDMESIRLDPISNERFESHVPLSLLIGLIGNLCISQQGRG